MEISFLRNMLPRIYHEVNQETVKLLFVFGIDVEVFIITCMVKYTINLFYYIRLTNKYKCGSGKSVPVLTFGQCDSFISCGSV